MNRLDGIDAKLDRAQQQIRALTGFPGTWTAREKPYGLRPEIDEGKRRYLWTLDVRKPFPPETAVVGDEIIHHLCSVLDHLAAHLVKASGGEPSLATAWPIVDSEWKWKREIEARQRPWQRWRRKQGSGKLRGIPVGSPIWALIENAQPYKSGRKAGEHPLFAIHQAWNANKHRILHKLWLEAMPEGEPSDLFDVEPDVEPIEARWIMEPGHKLYDGAEVAIFRFPLDAPIPAMKVKMDCKIPAQIAMGDDKGPPLPLDETLKTIRNLVTQAKALT
jgi:hypothetical protein